MKQFSIRILFAGLLLFNASSSFAQQAKPSNPNDNKTFRDLLTKNAAAIGIPKAEVNDAIISDAYTDATTGISFMYVQQAYKGIKVHNNIISVAFKNGGLQSAQGSFVPAPAQRANGVTPGKSAVEAVRAAAAHLKLNEQASFSTVADNFSKDKSYKISASGIAKNDIDVSLVYVASEDKQTLTLAWNVSINMAGSADWWNVRIDALTGAFIEKDNWTVYEDHHPASLQEQHHQPSVENNIPATAEQSRPAAALETLAPPNVTSATYRVLPFPVESPLYGGFANATDPWLLAGATNNATTNGWHFDGTNNYNITRGNNVFAFLDRNNTNTPNAANNWPDTSTTAAPTLTFINNFDPLEQPSIHVANKKVAVDNLFYWNNIIHDFTYQYGFTEPAGNFQENNIGRGGIGNDYVSAQAQDGSGFNNANFQTPPDGSSGIMQMYLYNSAPIFNITSPAAIAGTYAAVENSFNSPNKLVEVGPVTGDVVAYSLSGPGTSGCAAATNPAVLAGKIVLVDGTACLYASKVKNAQNAGAIGVIMYNPTLIGIGGNDLSITIPCIVITTATANAMLAQIGGGSPVTVTMAGGIRRDGDLDNGIIAHEYGHGVSIRLTGGPANSSCLNNAEQGGEGWSDYLALMIATNWATTPLTAGANPRPVGNYVQSQTTAGSGIRQYPYSTNLAVNPLTYSNVTASTTVHANGTVWCTALWDMTWNIIAQTGSINPNMYNAAHPGGNSIALNLVMTGLKLQKCSPGFLDSRDAILAADSILYNGTYRCAIWAAFAKRGMGFSARQGLSTNAGDQTPASDLPTSLKITRGSILQVAPFANQTITHKLTCDCAPLTNHVLRDTLPPGFTFVSSPSGATASGNIVTFPATSFAGSEVKNLSYTLQAPPATCPINLSINDNRDGNNAGGFTGAGTQGWSTVTTRSYSPVSSWFSPSPATVSENTLTSASQTLPVSNNVSILSFWHYYNTELNYDGCVVEYSTDGSTWLDAAPYFMTGGYNTNIAASAPLGGRRAWSGNNVDFKPVVLNLSSLGVGSLQVRFRSTTDNGVGGEGWFVDDIVRMNGCGGTLRTGVYNSSNVMIDATATPIFITTAPVPLTMLSFDARANSNGHVALQWKTAAEVNVKEFDVEWSTNNSNWTTVATVAAANLPSNRYSSLHVDPAMGINFYRLKIKDLDASFSFSETKTVNILNQAKTQPALVPNPVSQDAILYINKYNKPTTVKIFDATGALLQTLSANAGTQQIKITTGKLAAGTYIIETIGAERITTKMVVQK